MPQPQIIEDAHRFMRSHTSGELRFDEDFQPLPYVIGPNGRLAAPVTFTMLEAADTVLFVPQNAEGSMELQVTLSALDPDGSDGALSDRWRIYHGDPPDIYWALLDLDAARFEGSIIDGTALVRPNPIASDEPRLCRHVNEQHREDLRRIFRHITKTDVEQPMLVGVDPLGFDVRRRFDVVRLPSAEPMHSAEEVQRVFDRMVREMISSPPPEAAG